MVSSISQACLSLGDALGKGQGTLCPRCPAHSDQEDHNTLDYLLVTSKQVHTHLSNQGSQGVQSVLVLLTPSLWIHREDIAISLLS